MSTDTLELVRAAADDVRAAYLNLDTDAVPVRRGHMAEIYAEDVNRHLNFVASGIESGNLFDAQADYLIDLAYRIGQMFSANDEVPEDTRRQVAALADTLGELARRIEDHLSSIRATM